MPRYRSHEFSQVKGLYLSTHAATPDRLGLIARFWLMAVISLDQQAGNGYFS
jgi:hypothetical protein